jgi:pimeloyl-ACP methyl ester carboxylesterase
MKHHVIYIPGLGDHRPRGQQLVPKYWRLFGVEGHYCAMHWNDKEPFKPKLARLLTKIDNLAKDGSRVSLVGTSAGASVVLLAFAARPEKVTGVVCISGKINNPPAEHPRYIENPAFKESLFKLQQTLPKLSSDMRAHIMSIHPLWDREVPPADTIIPGTHERLIPVAGHVASIGAALAFYTPVIINFLKQQAGSH